MSYVYIQVYNFETLVMKSTFSYVQMGEFLFACFYKQQNCEMILHIYMFTKFSS